MPTLAEQALAWLDGNRPEEAIALASSFFEVSKGRRDGLDRAWVLREPATAIELERLRGRLIELVRSDSPMAGAAVFALGKLHDVGLTPFFIEVLRAHLARNAEVLYQAMIALDNLGEPVFAGANSMSVMAIAENRGLAAAYLRALGGHPQPTD